MCSAKLIALLTLWVGVTSIPHGDKTVFKMDKTNHTIKYRDCHQWYQAGYRESGTYEIWIHGEHPVKVHCENIGNTLGTTIQRREYGDFNFQQSWTSYVAGFGHMPPARGDFWLGLNTINYLTSFAGNSILTFVLQDWNNNIQQVVYQGFRVQGASQNFQMFVGSKISGSLLDDFSQSNGMAFATQDRPDPNHCALNQQCGWWFNYCSYTLPNGQYYFGGYYQPTTGYYNGVYWKDWYGYNYSMKFISMSVSHP